MRTSCVCFHSRLGSFFLQVSYKSNVTPSSHMIAVPKNYILTANFWSNHWKQNYSVYNLLMINSLACGDGWCETRDFLLSTSVIHCGLVCWVFFHTSSKHMPLSLPLFVSNWYEVAVRAFSSHWRPGYNDDHQTPAIIPSLSITICYRHIFLLTLLTAHH